MFIPFKEKEKIWVTIKFIRMKNVPIVNKAHMGKRMMQHVSKNKSKFQ